ncbi:hypothetical protein BpHYR1_012200 [Brachionus plicatilis]|uniref:Uncharacterized protein n=1 Tax=Brachionus plicatilis TaxID=10195 RepID=A0A3M7REF4_BRAPC|nr:hypothetical protein BpHYR1_012200 [Brachionus plicatilis]
MSSTSILENNFNDTCNFDSVRMDIPIQSNRKKGRPKKNTKGSPFCKMTKRRYWACPNKCEIIGYSLEQPILYLFLKLFWHSVLEMNGYMAPLSLKLSKHLEWYTEFLWVRYRFAWLKSKLKSYLNF